MRTKLLASALVLVAASLLFAGSAQGFRWHLSYWKAKRDTVREERRICNRNRRCVAFGASCKRITSSRVDCIGATWSESASGEIQCWNVYHWGVDRAGYIKLRTGPAHCRRA